MTILCSCTGINEDVYRNLCHLENAPDEVLYAGMFCGTCKEKCDEIKLEQKIKKRIELFKMIQPIGLPDHACCSCEICKGFIENRKEINK